jgi:hypothetical protein
MDELINKIIGALLFISVAFILIGALMPYWQRLDMFDFFRSAPAKRLKQEQFEASQRFNSVRFIWLGKVLFVVSICVYFLSAIFKFF